MLCDFQASNGMNPGEGVSGRWSVTLVVSGSLDRAIIGWIWDPRNSYQ